MSYPVYKVLHIASVFIFLISLGAIFRSEEKSKLHNILLGITSLLILVGGMGLIARMGIEHGSSWPIWLKTKVGIWAILVIGAPVMSKRIKSKRGLALGILGFFAIIAMYMAVNKPF